MNTQVMETPQTPNRLRQTIIECKLNENVFELPLDYKLRPKVKKILIEVLKFAIAPETSADFPRLFQIRRYIEKELGYSPSYISQLRDAQIIKQIDKNTWEFSADFLRKICGTNDSMTVNAATDIIETEKIMINSENKTIIDKLKQKIESQDFGFLAGIQLGNKERQSLIAALELACLPENAGVFPELPGLKNYVVKERKFNSGYLTKLKYKCILVHCATGRWALSQGFLELVEGKETTITTTPAKKKVNTELNETEEKLYRFIRSETVGDELLFALDLNQRSQEVTGLNGIKAVERALESVEKKGFINIKSTDSTDTLLISFSGQTEKKTKKRTGALKMEKKSPSETPKVEVGLDITLNDLITMRQKEIDRLAEEKKRLQNQMKSIEKEILMNKKAISNIQNLSKNAL
ncbi:MAG: hypothetical protein Q8Q23_00750 [bacterium]|nr:hypothetical protein [bacterium]